MGVVTDAWVRIEEWLTRHAPISAAVLAPPADPAEIEAAQATMSLTFPDELVESLRRHDGLLVWANILPEQPPLSVARIVEHRQMCMEIADDVDGFVPREPTGEPWWHPQWLPFAESDGDAQIIDLRPGPGYGRLGFAVHDGLGYFDDGWPSLGEYLMDVAHVLEEGGHVHLWYPYLTTKNELWWSLENETQLNDDPLRPAPTDR